MVNYGGDEVSALVLDIGTATIRAGYAGDDTPKVIMPTSYGYTPAPSDAPGGGDVNMEGPTEGQTTGENGEAQASGSGSGTGGLTGPLAKAKLHLGQHGPSLWREGMEIGNPMSGGIVQDFSVIPSLVQHAFVEGLRANPAEHPVLVTEPAWNTAANRERMAEIMFENFDVPAFYISNTGVLNAFAAGKGTAFVIDIGKSTASVTPVVDGFVLRKGIAYSALPQLVQAHARHILTNPSGNRPAIELFPHQLVGSKTPVEVNAKPIYTLRNERIPGVTPSWRDYYEGRETEEFVMAVAGVLDQGWNEQAAANRAARPYEFPTGFNTYFGAERFLIGEQFFTHRPAMVQSNPNLPKTLPALITQSLTACEPDMRPILLGNIVLTGGGSLFAGLSDRLSAELSRNFTHIKIHAPGNPVERRYGGWLGGSILASLGTFHQLWISREEWHEHGKSIVAQRCK